MIFVTLKFYTHSVPTERLSSWSLFLQTFRSYGTYLFGKIFYKHSLPTEHFIEIQSSIILFPTSLLRIFALPFFLQFFADFPFCSVFARNIELRSRNFIGQEFLVYKISFVRMGILIFFAII